MRRGRERLRLEPLEQRTMLAADMGLISGTVYSDLTGDGQTADDELLSGVMVELFRDGGDRAPGGDDTLVNARTTDASGQYAFEGLAAGQYFVRQTVPDGYITRPGENVVTVDISAEAAAGTLGLTIDSFESAQSASAASNAEMSDATALADPAVLGGERDLFVELLSGMGTIELDSDSADMGILQLSTSESTLVIADVVWDGIDGDGAGLDATGLGGIDLTTSAAGGITALFLETGAEQAGAQLTLQVFTNDDNFSEAIVDVPDTGGLANQIFCIPFTEFTASSSGTGADFTNVGAIRLVFASGESAVGMQVERIGTVGSSVFDVDFANLPAVVDLAVTKADRDDPAVAGEELTYVLTVTNNGTSAASGVVLTDTLPSNVEFISATSTQGEQPAVAEGVVTADLGTLAPGGTATVRIVVDTSGSFSGVLTNSASVTSAETDTNVDDNIVTEETAVERQVDLAIAKTDSSDPATAGETLTYTLTVTNNGPSDATGVTVTDTLPEGVTLSSATASQGEMPSEMEGVVTAALGDLAAGDSAMVTIVVDVGPNTFGTITNTAAVAAKDTETDETNNAVSETTEVEIEPALLSGRVFVDFGNDGLFDGRDVPIPGVMITLTGMDITGAEIDRTMLTDENGRYEFTDLLPGTYRIQETQPGFFPDGQESVGTAGGTALDNVFEMIGLAGGMEGLDYNFAELVPTLSKRQFLASSGGLP